MTTVLDKQLKRQVAIDGVDYTVVIDPDGVRVTGKGKRKAEVALRWRDLLSGEAALSVALNASLAMKTNASPAVQTAGDRHREAPQERTADAAPKKRARQRRP